MQRHARRALALLHDEWYSDTCTHTSENGIVLCRARAWGVVRLWSTTTLAVVGQNNIALGLLRESFVQLASQPSRQKQRTSKNARHSPQHWRAVTL